jgi:DNA-nicking Smr family endonuclease
MAKERPFHNPFSGLKLEKPKPAPVRKPPEPKAAPVRASGAGLGEEELWRLATDGVDPLPDRSGRVRPEPQPISVALAPLDPELEAYDELRALVDGEAPFDLANGDEFIDGAVQGLDPRIRKRLARGDYAVQGHLDLHGQTREEAKGAVERFLRDARRAGQRCVVVVHGRGLHSRDQLPVLKEALKSWLGQARFARHVLAFATARPCDGGAGAVYVLLRRPGR